MDRDAASRLFVWMITQMQAGSVLAPAKPAVGAARGRDARK